MEPTIRLEPDVALEQDGLRVKWRLTNELTDELELIDSWLPHGQFFAERLAFNPPLRIAPVSTVEFDRRVRLSACVGESVENAFLNLRLILNRSQWRVLARLRVDCPSEGLVVVGVRSVTSHPVGFATSGRIG
jgi:hypothetical protein